ncbi:MAG: hypothetical protein HC888_07475 [Candidatus Competibacteraceae bacterium]|nr:hypothetical protein [Candidatus Competibacteraceae bacterium]
MNDDIRYQLGIDVDSGQVRRVKDELKSLKKDVEGLQGQGVSRGNAVDSLSTLGGGSGMVSTGLNDLASGNILDMISGLADITEGSANAARGLKETTGALAGNGGLLKSVVKLGAVGAVAAAAVVALGIAFDKFMKQAQKQTKELNSVVDAQRDLGQQIAEGLTSEDAQKQLDLLVKQREAEQEVLAKLEDGWKDMNRELGGTADAVALVEPRVKALKEQLSTSKESMASFDAQIQALTGALENGRLSANDAAASERKLAEERAQLEEKEAVEAEKELAESTQRLSDALKEGADRVADLQRDLDNTLSDIKKQSTRASKDARDSLRRDVRELGITEKETKSQIQRETNDELAKLARDAAEDEKSARRRENFDIAQLLRDAGRSQKQLWSERNFLAQDQLSRETEYALEDAKYRSRAEAEERQANRDMQLKEMQNASSIQLRELQISTSHQVSARKRALDDELRDIRTATERQVEDAKTATEREIQITQQGIQRKLALEAEYWQKSAEMIGGGRAGPTTNQANSTYNTALTINGSGLSGNEMQLVGLNILRRVGIS